MDKIQESKIILGMIMLQDKSSFSPSKFRNDYRSRYSNKIAGLAENNSSLTFTTEDETIAIEHIQTSIPFNDIEAAARYAYNWQTAIEDTQEHKSHLIVSVMPGGQNQVKRFRILTQVICSLLRTTNSIGVYEGSQSLLIQKEDYLAEAEMMNDSYLPINLWIYFGLLANKDGISGYTYGLKEFDKTEIEIVNSSKSPEEIRGILFNIAHYVLDYDVTFQDGQTFGLSEDERIAISFSKGHSLKSETFKLAYA